MLKQNVSIDRTLCFNVLNKVFHRAEHFVSCLETYRIPG